MNLEDLREFVLSLENVEECFPFGPDTLVYKVNSKIFLITGFDNKPVRFNVKCQPEIAIELREKYPNVAPAYHQNKKHWNTITCDDTMNSQELKHWIINSYNLVCKKK